MTKLRSRGLAEQLFMEFAAELLARLAVWTKQTVVAQTVEERPQFHDNDPFPSRTTREAPCYALTFVSHIDDPFWEGEPVLSCAREHYKQGLYPGSQWLDQALDESMMHRLIHSYLPQPVVHALQIHGPGATLDEVRQAYRQFADAWSCPISRYDISFPLVGLTGAVSSDELALEASISEGLRFAPLTTDDKNRLWRYRTEFPYMERLDEELLARTQFQLTGTFAEYLPRQFPSDALASDMYGFLLALRLHKAGDVGAPIIFRTGLEPTTSDSTEAHSFPFGELRPFPRNYTLEPGDLAQVRALLQRLDALDTCKGLPALQVALRRYMQSRTRSMPEDRIIDLTIALESCLLGRESELAYRFPLRGAALLVRNMTLAPSRVVTLLDALYSSRNKIVHEGRSLNQLASLISVSKAAGDGDVSELLEHWEEMARLILHELQLRLLAGMEKATPTGKVPKPDTVMQNIRESLDAVLVQLGRNISGVSWRPEWVGRRLTWLGSTRWVAMV